MNRLIAFLVSLIPIVSYAHSFGTPYVPPIPLWMYVYGGAATLIVTFAVMGVFVSASQGGSPTTSPPAGEGTTARRIPQGLVFLLRLAAVGALAFTIASGFLGTQDAAHNPAMTLFWVVFLLAFAYLTLFIGDVYRLINPWQSMVHALERVGLELSRPRWAYPRRLGYWSAFALYAALIWMELFIAPMPRTLSIALLIYSAITFVGVALFGKAVWFDRADPFAVFFRLIGILAPLSYQPAEKGRSWQVKVRAPFTSALTERPDYLSLTLFMLLVLAATSYDAIHETTLWVGLYWKNLLWLLQPLWGEDLGKAQETLMGGYLVYRQVGLVVFPFVYLALYWVALWGAKLLTRTTISTRSLALSFCYSLLPIAIAYHFTHYFPFLMDQAGYFASTNMSVIWHTQVGVLVFGHLVSVYLAHRVAIQVFPTQRAAVVSQLPLLVLMVAYTVFGLWILSLPLAE